MEKPPYMKPNKRSISTRAIHGRQRKALLNEPVVTPIYQTSTYRFESTELMERYNQGDESLFLYSRHSNPLVHEVEERLALMEDGEAAVLLASGMAAISTAVFSVVASGEEIVSTPNLYGGTYRFFRDTLPEHSIRVHFVDPNDLESAEQSINEKTKMVYFETPTNPSLGIVDIEKIVGVTRRAEQRLGRRILTVIDNTFATIVNQKPFNFGVDVIIESGTKYLGGHSDILAGAVIGKKEFIRSVRDGRTHFGGCMDPFAAYLLLRSLKTLELRVRQQNENAMQLAGYLQKHPKVNRVFYPGLESHPQHSLAKKQMTGFGGMVTAEMKGGVKAAAAVADNLKIALNATSLGGVETLVSIPVHTSHANMGEEELKRSGVSPAMIRISVGIEDVSDLVRDFEQALGEA
jgi:methionine-gamma-lyase